MVDNVYQVDGINLLAAFRFFVRRERATLHRAILWQPLSTFGDGASPKKPLDQKVIAGAAASGGPQSGLPSADSRGVDKPMAFIDPIEFIYC